MSKSLTAIIGLIAIISAVVVSVIEPQSLLPRAALAEGSNSSQSGTGVTGVELLNVQFYPTPIRVGDYIKLQADVVNNSPQTIHTFTGCISALSLEPLDNKIQRQDTTRNCIGSNNDVTISPGQTVSIEAPGQTVFYEAVSSGTSNVSVRFEYSLVNSTQSYQVVKQLGVNIEESNGTVSPPNPEVPSINVTSETDRVSYSPGDIVQYDLSISNPDLSAAQAILITVSNPENATIVTRTLTTDEHGAAKLSFRLPPDAVAGTYEVTATGSIDAITFHKSIEFTVNSSLKTSIVSVQPTDQQGNPVSNFTKGRLNYVKVIIASNSSSSMLVSVNVFDSNSTTLGVGSVKSSFGSGNSEILISFFVPDYSVRGTGNIYVNALSDWPSMGGLPVTHEQVSRVQIS